MIVHHYPFPQQTIGVWLAAQFDETISLDSTPLIANLPNMVRLKDGFAIVGARFDLPFRDMESAEVRWSVFGWVCNPLTGQSTVQMFPRGVNSKVEAVPGPRRPLITGFEFFGGSYDYPIDNGAIRSVWRGEQSTPLPLTHQETVPITYHANIAYGDVTNVVAMEPGTYWAQTKEPGVYHDRRTDLYAFSECPRGRFLTPFTNFGMIGSVPVAREPRMYITDGASKECFVQHLLFGNDSMFESRSDHLYVGRRNEIPHLQFDLTEAIASCPKDDAPWSRMSVGIGTRISTDGLTATTMIAHLSMRAETFRSSSARPNMSNIPRNQGEFTQLPIGEIPYHRPGSVLRTRISYITTVTVDLE